jgi:hypothetical protein
MTHPGRAASALGSTGHANHDHTSRRKLPVRSGGVRPAAAALASGRRPGIPESGSGTTAADGGRPGRPRRSRAAGRDPPTASHWPVQDRRRLGRPGARSTRPRQLRSRRHGLRPAVPGRAQDPHRRAGLDRRPPRAPDRPHPKHTPAHRPPTASKPRQGRRTRQPRVRSDQLPAPRPTAATRAHPGPPPISSRASRHAVAHLFLPGVLKSSRS